MTNITVIRKVGFPSEGIELEKWIAAMGGFPELTRIDMIKKGAKRIDTDGSAMLTSGGPRVGFFFFDSGQICVHGASSMFGLVQAVANKLEARVLTIADDECLKFQQLLVDFASLWPNKSLHSTPR